MSTPSLLTHRAIRAVVAALSAAGVPDAAALIRIMPETAPTAAAAAAQLGCPVGAIANSLVFDVAGEPLLVLTSGAHRVDPKALGPRIGLSRSAIKRAKPDDVKKATGQAIGGVAPVGHLQKIRTLVDEELRQYDVVWAAGGHHMAVYPSDFETLVRVTDGEVVKVD
jgi:prolyl-tRNA editing enzyme YbaK/EbsC (Cys-tRNA(Pro) deacylase)